MRQPIVTLEENSLCCNTPLRSKTFNDGIVHFCGNCYMHGTVLPPSRQCCFSPELIPVRKTYSDGRVFVHEYCTNCDKVKAGAKKNKNYNLASLPFVNATEGTGFGKFVNRLYELHNEYVERTGITWESRYSDYLQSEKWQLKRQQVFARSPMCEFCLEFEATQVHHLTYERVFNEDLEDLKSICQRCHDDIPNRFNDRGHPDTQAAILNNKFKQELADKNANKLKIKLEL